MAAVTLTAAAACRACDWTAEGDPDPVDRAAERHWRNAGHTVTVKVVPA